MRPAWRREEREERQTWKLWKSCRAVTAHIAGKDAVTAHIAGHEDALGLASTGHTERMPIPVHASSCREKKRSWARERAFELCACVTSISPGVGHVPCAVLPDGVLSFEPWTFWCGDW